MPRELFEKRYAAEIANGDMSWDELQPETQAAICEKCGIILDSETPIDESDPVVCSRCCDDLQ